MKRHFEYQTLRAFVMVAREGNVSRAAERLHLSQPAVSLQLKSLVEATGKKLFIRTPLGLALTPDGVALLPNAEKALAAATDFSRAVDALQRTVRGTLRIGTILDPEFIRLGSFLKSFVETSPYVKTELRQLMSGEVISEIIRGKIDVGFSLDIPDAKTGSSSLKTNPLMLKSIQQIDKRELARFCYFVVAPPGWGPQVIGRGWDALASLPWLETPQVSVHSRLLATVFGTGSATGLEPPRVALVDQEASMLDLVKSGVGLSLVRDSIAIRESQANGLAIADKVRLQCQLNFLSRSPELEDTVIKNAQYAIGKTWL